MDETLTIAPPLPPFLVDMRRVASATSEHQAGDIDREQAMERGGLGIRRATCWDTGRTRQHRLQERRPPAHEKTATLDLADVGPVAGIEVAGLSKLRWK